MIQNFFTEYNGFCRKKYLPPQALQTGNRNWIVINLKNYDFEILEVVCYNLCYIFLEHLEIFDGL